MRVDAPALRLPLLLLLASVALGGASNATAADPVAGVTAFGVRRPQQFLQDAIAGTSSVDILLIGDSNVGYDGGAFQRGFAGGFVDAMLDAGADMYATAICTAASDTGDLQLFQPFGGVGARQMYEAEISVGTGPGAPGEFCRGSLALPAESQPFYGVPVGGPALRATSARTDWLYYASPSIDSPYLEDAVYLARASVPHRLSADMAITFRLGVVRFPGSTGVLRPSIHRASDLSVCAGPGVVSAQAASAVADVAAAEIALPADLARGAVLGMHGAYPMRGPVGVLFRSFYRHGPGFAVTPVAYNAGEGSDAIASAVSAAGTGMITSYLREARERQIASGGPGRVLVFTNSGVNGDSPAGWRSSVESIIVTVRNAWSSLGYPPEDLAFMPSVSAPTADTDDMAVLRRRARTISVGAKDTAFVDFGACGPFLRALGLWDSRGNAHLATDGYRRLIAAAITAPRSHLPDFNADGVVDARDLVRVLGAWGTSEADLNGDGLTDSKDLGKVLGYWGPVD